MAYSHNLELTSYTLPSKSGGTLPRTPKKVKMLRFKENSIFQTLSPVDSVRQKPSIRKNSLSLSFNIFTLNKVAPATPGFEAKSKPPHDVQR